MKLLLKKILLFLLLLAFVYVVTDPSIYLDGRFAVMKSRSMEPAMSPNDLFFVKQQPDYSVGDVILFRSGQGEVAHRIVDKRQRDGGYVYSTKGDNNTAQLSYEKEVTESQILGAVRFSLFNVYAFFALLWGIRLLIAYCAYLFLSSRIFKISRAHHVK